MIVPNKNKNVLEIAFRDVSLGNGISLLALSNTTRIHTLLYKTISISG